MFESFVHITFWFKKHLFKEIFNNFIILLLSEIVCFEEQEHLYLHLELILLNVTQRANQKISFKRFYHNFI